MCVIMSAYVIKPHLMRRSYLSALKLFFGSSSKTTVFHTRKQLTSPVLSSTDLKKDAEEEESAGSAGENEREERKGDAKTVRKENVEEVTEEEEELEEAKMKVKKLLAVLEQRKQSQGVIASIFTPSTTSAKVSGPVLERKGVLSERM